MVVAVASSLFNFKTKPVSSNGQTLPIHQESLSGKSYPYSVTGFLQVYRCQKSLRIVFEAERTQLDSAFSSYNENMSRLCFVSLATVSPIFS